MESLQKIKFKLEFKKFIICFKFQKIRKNIKKSITTKKIF